MQFFSGPLFFIGFVASVILLAVTLYLFIYHRITTSQFVFWSILYFVLAIISIFPIILDQITRYLDISVRGLFVLGIGLLVVYLLVYNLSISQQRTEKRLRELNQAVALLIYQQEYLEKSKPHESSITHNNVQ